MSSIYLKGDLYSFLLVEKYCGSGLVSLSQILVSSHRKLEASHLQVPFVVSAAVENILLHPSSFRVFCFVRPLCCDISILLLRIYLCSHSLLGVRFDLRIPITHLKFNYKSLLFSFIARNTNVLLSLMLFEIGCPIVMFYSRYAIYLSLIEISCVKQFV